jgi:nitrate reductase assembly molybdenum cofactor insertion protein NarJ
MKDESNESELFGQAAQWRLISLLLECPSEGWWEQMSLLSDEVEDEELKTAVASAREGASQGLYHSILGPGGPAPAREVSYRDWAEPGYLIAELVSYYDAFSYHPASAEAPDHVSVEAGFIGYLRFKQAYAIACQDAERGEVAAEAARNFIEEHLSTIAEPLAIALANSGVNYLALASNALLSRVGRRRNKTRSRALPVLVDEESGFDCGQSG